MLKFKMINAITIILILSTITYSFGQEADHKVIGSLLKIGKVDSLFIFNSSSANAHNELRIKYLGSLKSKRGKRFKIISYCWIWGKAERATNRILVYNTGNKYIGCYRVDTTDELPEKVINNKLIFNIKEDEKSKLIRTRISFEKGLPQEIIIRNGNLYPFESSR